LKSGMTAAESIEVCIRGMRISRSADFGVHAKTVLSANSKQRVGFSTERKLHL
jgi:hypothetical protein